MRRLPATLPLGLLIIAASAAMLAIDVHHRTPPPLAPPADTLGRIARWVAINFTPLCWVGYLFTLDGLLNLPGRGREDHGGSPLRARPNRFIVAWLTSIPVWCFFDWINFYFMDAWRYHGLPPAFWQRVVGYFLAFAAITPGLFLTATWILRRLPRTQPPPDNSRLVWSLVLIPPAIAAVIVLALLPSRDNHLADPRSIVGTAILLLGPATAAFYRTRSPLVTAFAIGVGFTAWAFIARDPLANLTLWTGILYLLDPVNAALGAPSLLRDWQAGRWQRSVALGTGGLICGLLWELWNYWALARWTYHLPFLGPLEHLRYFEMPLPGLLGFIPFAGECWVVLNTLLALLQRLAPGRLNIAEPLPDDRAIL